MKMLRQNAIAFLALFVALSGSAYAATKIGGHQIQRQAISAGHIKPNSISPKHLRRGAVGPMQIRRNAVYPAHLRVVPRGPQGQQGPSGEDGDDGSRGSQGPRGPAGLSDLQVVHSPIVTIPPGDSAVDVANRGGPELRAECPSGKVVVGTGFFAPFMHTDGIESYETFAFGYMNNETSSELDGQVQAICAHVE